MYSREPLYENLPCIVLTKRNILSSPFKIVFIYDNKDSKYQLPKQIADNSNVLMAAHSQSKIYNQMCIRIKDISVKKDNDILIDYMRTTYYDSLITNRVMDYTLPNGKTIRDIYEPGPFLNNFSQSKLSNHLGFNGFVELKDGEIIFVERNDRVSIGKNTFGTSVGASFKVKYGVDDEFNITNETIANAIKSEVFDELKIDISKIKLSCSNLTDSIFAFYRDIVEGGKPQFLFYIKLIDYSWDDFINGFNLLLNNKNYAKEDKKYVVTDGKKFVHFTIDEMKRFKYKNNGFYDTKNSWHNAMPAVIASMKLLIESS